MYEYINLTPSPLEGSAGVSLNGVMIQTGTSLEMIDAYFPKKWSGALVTVPTPEIVDACTGHPF